jgi:hypothetical protein
MPRRKAEREDANMSTKIPATSADYDSTHIIERPDGFYWQSIAGGREYGPFPSLIEAVEDMESSDSEIEVGESLQEAEDEIGIAAWIDPETGQPAEESIPNLDNH